MNCPHMRWTQGRTYSAAFTIHTCRTNDGGDTSPISRCYIPCAPRTRCLPWRACGILRHISCPSAVGFLRLHWRARTAGRTLPAQPGLPGTHLLPSPACPHPAAHAPHHPTTRRHPHLRTYTPLYRRYRCCAPPPATTPAHRYLHACPAIHATSSRMCLSAGLAPLPPRNHGAALPMRTCQRRTTGTRTPPPRLHDARCCPLFIPRYILHLHITHYHCAFLAIRKVTSLRKKQAWRNKNVDSTTSPTTDFGRTRTRARLFCRLL